MTPNSPAGTHRWVHRAWGLALVVLIVGAMWRMGAFDLTVTLESGRVVPNTYGTVDHPFHASRAASLIESLRNGEILRWMGSHQGGYPVEFYPLGAAWLEVILWAGFFGNMSILAIHKLAVAMVFVLPALAYWLLVRGDKLHPSIAFLAMAFHLAIPGYWLNGGYEELVGWGLITNVAGATLAVISTVLLARFVMYRQHLPGVFAVVTISAGAVTNPRSLFGVVLATLAIAVWSASVRNELPPGRRLVDTVVPIGVVGTLALCISAPVIFALMRYNEQYFFLHYQFYDPISMFWDAMEMALSRPVLLLGLAGIILVFIARLVGHIRVSQIVAITTVLYSIFTIWVATTTSPPPLVEQLEAPRLMPFQRLLMLILAAIFLVVVVQRLTARMADLWREILIAVVVIAIGTGSIVFMSVRTESTPTIEKAMYSVSTVGDQRFADIEDAVKLANDLRPEGTAIFVIGNHNEWWHEQLWAPGIADGTYYYDDWLWYWHTDQPGPYDWTQGYWMQNPSDALTGEYLAHHGIGVVMVSDMWVPAGDAPRQSASENELLEFQGTFGSWDVYTVNQPASIATRGDTDTIPVVVTWSNQEITASFEEGDGPVTVRQNWFPRWVATVNGEPAKITRTDGGYMQIETPSGPVEITLVYGVTVLDWTARVTSGVGLVGLMLFGLRGKRIREHIWKKESNELSE